ncbi:hypothetical protein CEP51_000738 [Fusarium floridanum]|uniref:DNA2/NAM7 helicase-like C-terminal domain-containing protein n=1 Tax=Fusarium floridanum TaxID=1325733 RepID=A0A428SKK4_9HYPO|nr:hypothetical protein CEP51_000738 [Fusarium floridanum]
MTKVDPAVFGSSLPRADIKLLRQSSVSMAEPGKTSKIGERLTKEQLLKVQQVNEKRALQRDVAQGQSLASLATDAFTPIRHISFLGRHRESLQRAILGRVNEKDRAAFMEVLSKVTLGILPIVGFADSGPMIVCTPTHAAASNIAARVNKLASLAYGKAKERMPVIVRGFSWKVDELRGKVHALGGDATHDNWEHPLSMVDWMQRVLRPENLKPGIVKPALYKLAKDVEKDTKIINLKNTLHNRKGWTVAHSQAFRDLATRILEVADVVCYTTHVSTKDILADWAWDKAQSTFLDEAGAISMPEALAPWFDGRSLKSWTGGPLNLFDKHQEISVLERLMRMQWPCWSSQRQNRIVNGGFDLAREIFYPELGDKFEYGDQCAVSKRPGASQLESWVRRQFPGIKPSPTGKIWPVFINCLHTAVRTIDTWRVNFGQAEIALALMETPIKAHGTKFGVVSPYSATKAYLEGLIRQRLDKSTKDSALYKGLSNVQVSTADSFQGKEADVAIFLTTVTQESGPGFVKDARRFNVGVTRHVDCL